MPADHSKLSNCYKSEWATVCDELRVDPNTGLDVTEAQTRLSINGPNEIERRVKRPLWQRLIDQFRDFMILVLLVAAVVAGIAGELLDTFAIVLIVVLNAVIGFIQEYRAEKALEALQALMMPTVQVRRSGSVQQIPAEDLVQGDIVLLTSGQRVTADLRLIESADLRVEEAALTGESVPVSKQTGALDKTELPLGDRSNMAFSGTLVNNGHASGVVVATGMGTELGRIADLISQGKTTRTPLQQRLDIFGKRLALVVLGICLLIFVGGVIRGESILLMFLTAVSLAVAAVPEALPAVVTIALALGAKRMVAHNALVRRLPSVETLGSVTYICSDKTGTLTENKMHTERFYADGELLDHLPEEPARPWDSLVEGMLFNNDAAIDDAGHATGDPTEIALLEAVHGTRWTEDTM